MQFYVADYLADTRHLTTEEHGAYLLLIFSYWQTAKPLDKRRLARIAGLPNERWACVEQVLNEFFIDTGDEWVHARIEADIESVEETQNKKVKAGKASAAARKREKAARVKQALSERSTGVEQVLNSVPTEGQQKPTITDTDTDTELNTTDPNGSGAAAPTENKPGDPSADQPNESLLPPEPEKPKPPNIWDIGVPLLVEQGMKEPSARALIAKLSKDFSDVEVGKALVTASMRNPVPADLRSWLPRALQHQRDGPRNKPGAALHTFDDVDYSYGVTADGGF